MIVIKSEREIKLMEEAGQVLAKVFEEIEPLVVPGVSTQQLNDKCEQIIRSEGAIPTELGYQGYPAAICASCVSWISVTVGTSNVSCTLRSIFNAFSSPMPVNESSRERFAFR